MSEVLHEQLRQCQAMAHKYETAVETARRNLLQAQADYDSIKAACESNVQHTQVISLHAHRICLWTMACGTGHVGTFAQLV